MLVFLLWLLVASEDVTHTKNVSGLATIYYPGAQYVGKYKANSEILSFKDRHIAHRTIKLGTEGVICNLRTKKCAYTRVEDRGPFGSIMPCSEPKPSPLHYKGRIFPVKQITWKKKCYYWQTQPGRLRPGFKYRGTFDISLKIAQEIQLRAFDPVRFFYVKEKKSHGRHLSVR